MISVFRSFSLVFLIFLTTNQIDAFSWPWQKVIRWDWASLEQSGEVFWDALSLRFPATFSWGVGDSAFQTEGTQTTYGSYIKNNWTEFKKTPSVDTGIDRWNRYQEDIDNVVACGFNTYRMSVEWAKIEPEEGVFDQEALDHYGQVFKYAKSKNLKVTVVLWHHTWPLWFGDKQGWEEQENNAYFLKYVGTVVEKLKDCVDVWIPFNEPDGYAMQGFFRGEYPPCKKDLALAGKVIANMLDAHVKSARKIRELAPNAQISITKVVQHIDPYRWWHPIEGIATSIFDNLFNTAFINFFKTGTFKWYIPGKVDVQYTNPEAINSINFFGVNYYSHSNIKFNVYPKPGVDSQAAHACETKTDNGHVIYPEGLYRALQLCAELNKPLIITENGLADAHDQYRDMYIRRHLYAVAKFMADYPNTPVLGYHYWSLTDNYEWTHGYEHKFGLFAVNRENNCTRTLRPSAQGFVDFVKNKK